MGLGHAQTGIGVVGEVPWGTHFCQFYKTEAELLELLVPYFKAGLENNEVCVWLTSEHEGKAAAIEALTAVVGDLPVRIEWGQIEILYLPDRLLDASSQDILPREWRQMLEQGQARGYSSLRVAADFGGPKGISWDRFIPYEAAINRLRGEGRLVSICSFCEVDLGISRAVEIAGHHEFAMARTKDGWRVIEHNLWEQTRLSGAPESEAGHENGSELRRSQQLLQAMNDHNPDVLAVYDLSERRLRYASRALAKVLGYTEEGLSGIGSLELALVHPDDIGSTQRDTEQALALAHGEAMESEYRYRHAGGGYRWFRNRVSVFKRGRDGKPSQIFIVSRDITEEKRAGEAREQLVRVLDGERSRAEDLAGSLRRERDLLVSLMENTRAHFAYLDRDFNFVRVNSTYAYGSGHTQAELIGKNHFDLFPNEENQAIFERVRDTGQAVEYHDKPFVFADQPHRDVTYWDWTLAPVKDEAGRVHGLVLSLVDTTPRKCAEIELERRAVRSEALHRVSEALAETLEPEEVAMRVLATFTEALGLEGGGLWLVDSGASRLQALAHRYPLPEVDEQMAARPEWDIPYSATGLAVRTGEIQVGEGISPQALAAYPALAGLGHKFIVGAPLKAKGQVIGVVSGICSQRTEINEADRELLETMGGMAGMALANAIAFEQVRTAQREWQQTFDAMSDGLAILDTEHTILRANRAMAQMLGTTVGALTGRKCYHVVHGLDAPLERCPQPSCIENRSWSEMEYQEPRLGNRWLRVRVEPMLAPDGRLAGVVHNVRDITERKAVEMLKEEFINMVSHEMRTPLTVLIGGLHTVLTDGAGIAEDERARLIRDAYLEAESLSDIVSNLLEASRARADRLSL
ncbi:MAG: PAS domain S-box protein, partial [Chloroflexi bacterium]|nr:PAS domain S-box protein [Chloroflexota bacterium]